MGFFLLGQPGKLGVQRVFGIEKRFLAMEDRRIGRCSVIEAFDRVPIGAKRSEAIRQAWNWPSNCVSPMSGSTKLIATRYFEVCTPTSVIGTKLQKV